MKKAEPSLRSAIHVVHGRGEVLAVRTLDSGALVADLQFPDGTRTIRLDARYWTSDISALRPTAPPKPKRERKAKADDANAPANELQLHTPDVAA